MDEYYGDSDEEKVNWGGIKTTAEAVEKALDGINKQIEAVGQREPEGVESVEQPDTEAGRQDKEGDTATNAQTGERMIYRGGRWERL